MTLGVLPSEKMTSRIISAEKYGSEIRFNIEKSIEGFPEGTSEIVSQCCTMKLVQRDDNIFEARFTGEFLEDFIKLLNDSLTTVV